MKEGRRDEHGMEEVDGLFSSPEKSPAELRAFDEDNGSSTGSDGMSLDEGAPSILPRFLRPDVYSRDAPKAMRQVLWTFLKAAHVVLLTSRRPLHDRP